MLSSKRISKAGGHHKQASARAASAERRAARALGPSRCDAAARAADTSQLATLQHWSPRHDDPKRELYTLDGRRRGRQPLWRLQRPGCTSHLLQRPTDRRCRRREMPRFPAAIRAESLFIGLSVTVGPRRLHFSACYARHWALVAKTAPQRACSSHRWHSNPHGTIYKAR